jgi:hypothetical protein
MAWRREWESNPRISIVRATDTARKHPPASCPQKFRPCTCATSLLTLAAVTSPGTHVAHAAS